MKNDDTCCRNCKKWKGTRKPSDCPEYPCNTRKTESCYVDCDDCKSFESKVPPCSE